MTNPTIPTNIPTPRVTDYSAESVDPIQRTAMSSGKTRTRERWRHVPQMYNINYRLTDQQFRQFEGFLVHETHNGTRQFNLRMRMPRSTDLSHYLVQVASYPTWNWVEASARTRGYWDVNFRVQTITDTRTSYGEYVAEVIGMPLADAIAYLADGINTYWLRDYQ